MDRIFVSKSESEIQHRSQHSKHISHEGEGSGGDRGVRVASEYAQHESGGMTQSGEWSHVMKEESGEVSEDLGVMTWSRSVDREVGEND